mmetsp:Transcript_9239/g.17394  ORF Transcript_9239/g.17394 Transcript_9239/m.17394 type:complete len:184 (+) Transcript_9239:71-622(+)
MNNMMLSTINCLSTASMIILSIIGTSYSLSVAPQLSFYSRIPQCCSYSALGSRTTKLHDAYNNNNKDDNEGDNDSNGNQKNVKSKSLQEQMDAFLDRPFFDPDQILDNQNKNSRDGSSDVRSSWNPLVWFANLVKNDYQTAEALYTAGFISIMVILAQELLRMVRYGDAYHPFQNISSGGSLF